MFTHNNPELRARQKLSLAKSKATREALDAAMAELVFDEMMNKLLHAMDRRDPWTAEDLLGWVWEQYPHYLLVSFDHELKTAEFAEAIAAELKDDPAFPLIVANLLQIAAGCRSISESRAAEAP
jgi:N-acyl-D-aspartate/D-glutamate deacylase